MMAKLEQQGKESFGGAKNSILSAKQSGVSGQGVPSHHAQDHDGRGGISETCKPTVRRSGAARHDCVPAGQGYEP